MTGNVLGARLDITLAPFTVGDAEVWMPVAGDYVGYGAVENHKPIVVKDPTVLDTMKLVDGTMRFNNHPGPEVFTIKHKLGKPISENLRRLEYEFSGQQPRTRPKSADAQRMLRDQLAKVQEQASDLSADSPSPNGALISWLVFAFGAVVLSLVTLWIERRRHFG